MPEQKWTREQKEAILARIDNGEMTIQQMTKEIGAKGKTIWQWRTLAKRDWKPYASQKMSGPQRLAAKARAAERKRLYRAKQRGNGPIPASLLKEKVKPVTIPIFTGDADAELRAENKLLRALVAHFISR